MKKIVECVPNFSEGRNPQVLEEIKRAVLSVSGVSLLNVDPGFATNRTVFTFVGEPQDVSEAAFQAIKKAAETIDMRLQHGAHPRMGASDVVPFVPVQNVSMEECAELAKSLGKRVGEELSIPVYLYEAAAPCEERRSLSHLREGEYESLPQKLGSLLPDFGPRSFDENVARTGATVIGAREFLIAYNVNLNTKDKKLANEIALTIRENGRIKKDKEGNTLRDGNGTALREPGILSNVRAIGWYIDEYGIAQISINLLDYKKTPLWKVFETVREEADKLGLLVTGSEVVGLIPRDALLDTGRFYLSKQKRTTGVPEKVLIEIAVKSLNLASVSPFDPKERVVEYLIDQEEEKKRLTSLRVTGFVDEVSAVSPAPGGGSVSALASALASGLAAMVAALTHHKKGYEQWDQEYPPLGDRAQELKDEALRLIDEDTKAFNLFMEAGRLPKGTEEEKALRTKALEEAAQNAACVPYRIMETAVHSLSLLERISLIGNKNSISDAGVGGWMARGAAEGAYLNVLINLSSINDEPFRKEIRAKADKLILEARTLSEAVAKNVSSHLS